MEFEIINNKAHVTGLYSWPSSIPAKSTMVKHTCPILFEKCKFLQIMEDKFMSEFDAALSHNGSCIFAVLFYCFLNWRLPGPCDVWDHNIINKITALHRGFLFFCFHNGMKSSHPQQKVLIWVKIYYCEMLHSWDVKQNVPGTGNVWNAITVH